MRAKPVSALLTLLAVWLVIAQFMVVPAFSCEAPGDGSPSCGGSGPASLDGGGTASVMSGGGNPINLLSGNKYQEETDVAALPGVLGLELKRYYNSQSGYPGLAGAQWRTSYETVLYDLGTQVQIVQADGRRVTLQRGQGAKSQLCVSPQPQDGQVRIEQEGKDNVYHWRWPDGRTLTFRSLGLGQTTGYPLHGITAATGERVQLAYNPLGDLISVSDPQGRKLAFSYGKAAPGQRALLQAVASPLGRITYRHDELGRLTEVAHTAPNATGAHLTWLYHYEKEHSAGNVFALTGISRRAPGENKGEPRRLSTYAYDVQGRAILSSRGPRGESGKADARSGVEQLRVDYVSKPSPNEGRADRNGEVQVESGRLGRVRLTNAQGQVSELKTAQIGGQLRLVEFTGAGCPTCGPSNRRYAYDDAGRLLRSMELDATGQPLRVELYRYDPQGRQVEIAEQGYAGGKPQPAQWRQRLVYTDSHLQDGSVVTGLQPTRVEEPSVVPGKSRITEFQYNEAGQVLSWTRRGWSPRDAAGQPQPVAIQRSLRYRYETRNGRSLLAQVQDSADGPQSPGTRLEWDAAGSAVVAITRPGGSSLRIERDEAGQWRRVERLDGGLHQVLEARRGAASGLADGVLEVQQTAWWQAAGDGQVRQQRVIKLNRDGAGQLLGLDIDGRLVDDAAVAAPARTPGAATALDASGHPAAWLAADGSPLLSVRWGEGNARARETVAALTAGTAQAERQHDDFGRVVAIRNPYQGWQTARLDAAGRLEEWRDPRGARQVFKRDAQGRLLELARYAPGQAGPEQTLRWVDHGDGRLDEVIADADGERAITTVWDALGRQLSQTLNIRPAGALARQMQPVSLRIDEQMDATGLPRLQRLTDASSRAVDLVSRHDASGALVGLDSPGVLPAWLGGAGRLVDRVDWQHAPGLSWATGIHHADGSVERFGTLSVEDDGSAALAASGAGAQAQAPDRPWVVPGRDADVAGLPAAIRTAQGEQGLVWNAAGQLRASTRGAQDRTEYLYDARGRRVLTWRRAGGAPDAVALSLYDDRRRLVAEADSRGQFIQVYAWIGYRAVAQLDPAPQGVWKRLSAWLRGVPGRALHTDMAGRVVRMLDGERVLWSAASPGATAAGVHQPLRHVGQVQDEDSGLIYHGARFLEPGIGRFISPDPAGIADAVNDTGPARLLDLYAFAAGRPDQFFDPDGAARIRYFAITTDAKGKALGTTQGYTKARWAFIVDQVAAPSGIGGDATLNQLQNKYASSQQSLLVDINGDFLNGKSAETWLGEGGVSDLFTEHYGDNLISAAEFTVTMSDADATRLIASYIDADRAALYPGACPARSLLLPPIKFAAEEPEITVTSATSGDADKQRILACGEGSATDIDMRRVAKYEAASEINETAQINRDCSTDGCPGIGYYCDATKCYAPRDQLKYGAPNTTATVYTPSYGRSQFIGATLVSQLLAAYDTFTADQQTALGMTAARKTALTQASTRGAAMSAAWDAMTAAPTYAAANTAWSSLTAAQQQDFTTKTGLGEGAYTDMKRLKTQPPTNSNGVSLIGDAKQAFVTAAIMSDADIKTFLMDIFKDFDKFTTVSHNFMKANLDAAKAYKPDADERYLAAMVARAHNGGTWKRTYAQLTTTDQNDYVKNFIGTPGFKSKGDWNALRCTASFGKDTLVAGKNGKGIGGLQMTPLTLP